MKILILTLSLFASINSFAAATQQAKSCVDRGISYKVGIQLCVNGIQYKCTEQGWLKGLSCSK